MLGLAFRVDARRRSRAAAPGRRRDHAFRLYLPGVIAAGIGWQRCEDRVAP
jgi:hypothetical protein